MLGTGAMGFPVARNLLGAGFAVRVWSRTPERAQDLASDGAEAAPTPAEAVAPAEQDLQFVDSPVSTSVGQATEGKLIVLASGPDASRARVKLTLDAIGALMLWLGPPATALGSSLR